MKSVALPILLALSQLAQAELSIIAVEGSASIEVVPDIVRVEYSVSKIGKNDTSELKKEVDEIAARSIDALVSIGVDRDNISSPGLNVEQIPDYDRNDNFIGSSRNGVSRQIVIDLANIKLFSQVIQTLIDSGVSEIDDVEPDVSKYDDLKLKALVAAAKNAEKEAALLAETLGASLAGVHEIGKQKTRRNFSLEEIVVTARMREPDTSPIPYEFEPGTVEISANIYVEFNIE